jgi:DNA-directed RNA polymerase specialized sigma24 family protein
VLRAHRRLLVSRPAQPLDGIAHPVVDGQSSAYEAIQLGQCLSAARLHCSDEDYAILTAKLAGVPAREIGRAFHLTEATVDHRYRNTIERIREALSPRGRNVHV